MKATKQMAITAQANILSAASRAVLATASMQPSQLRPGIAFGCGVVMPRSQSRKFGQRHSFCRLLVLGLVGLEIVNFVRNAALFAFKREQRDDDAGDFSPALPPLNCQWRQSLTRIWSTLLQRIQRGVDTAQFLENPEHVASGSIFHYPCASKF